MDIGGFANLTTDFMNLHFNPSVPDHPDVQYYSYAAAKRIVAPYYLFPSALLLQYQKEGDNDGLVSIQSSKWGRFKGVFHGDHNDVIGFMENPYKPLSAHLKLYRQILIDLSREEWLQGQSK